MHQEKKNENERDFPGSGLAWDITEATGANKGPNRRNLRIFRRRFVVARQGEGFSSVAIIETRPKLSREEEAYENKKTMMLLG